MLRAQHFGRGISLIEAMVVLSIAALLMALAAPSFSSWLEGGRIRVTAESITSGLQYAKSEASARNAQVRFQLTSSLGKDCKLDSGGSNWVVDLVDGDDASEDSVEDNCDATPDDKAPPGILMTRAARDGGGTTAVTSDASSFVFTGYGRLTPVPDTDITIQVRPADATRCADGGGNITCLRVLVSPAGQVRMCNPSFPSDDPQGCPES